MGVWTSRAAAWLGAVLLGAVVASHAAAQDDAATQRGDNERLAREVQNPFSDLITVPFQNTANFGYSPENGLQNVLNIQPVVPVPIAKSWEILARPILPVSYSSVPSSEFGLGDVNLEAILSPTASPDLEWGVGVVLSAPTASRESLGWGKWTAGLVIGVYRELERWTWSLVVTQQWSYAGDRHRDSVSFLQISPGLNYNFDDGWYATFAPPVSADFSIHRGQQWLVPLGAGLGKLFPIGRQSLSVSLEGYWSVIHPSGGPRATAVFTVTLVFPE